MNLKAGHVTFLRGNKWQGHWQGQKNLGAGRGTDIWAAMDNLEFQRYIDHRWEKRDVCYVIKLWSEGRGGEGRGKDSVSAP